MEEKERLKQNDLIFHLEKAIENHEFEVFYQPIIHTISGSLCGFESLVRWQHPVHGFLNPGMFIPLLEDTKQIYHLDIHLIELVCQRFSEEMRLGHPVVPFSINLSRLDFESADMFAIIQDITARYQMPPRMLNIEITESAFSENQQELTETISRFRQAGYQVWMDDFGSGYSSLNTLKDFEFDELKIDMRFLSDMSFKSRQIISSMISMAKNIGMVTLVEGVETEEQIQFLKSIGCDRLQGYYFSKPLPYEQILQVLQEKQIPFETLSDRRYYHEINRINLLSPSPFSVQKDGEETHGGGIPLAILEEKEGTVRFIFMNAEFVEDLEVIGALEAMDAIQRLVHFGILTEKSIWDFLNGAIQDGDRKLDFSVNGDSCSARAKLVSANEGRHALLLSITNITRSMNVSHEQLMDQKLKNIYSLYLRVSILRPLKNELVTVFTQDHHDIPTDVPLDMSELTNQYAMQDVATQDREDYIRFVDSTTIEARIRNSKRGFINTKIHTRDENGEFSNKMYLAVAMGNNEVLLLVRYATL